jgi:hypothetical protein
VTQAKKPAKKPATARETAKPTVSTRAGAAPAQQAMTSSQMGIAIEWTERRARGGWRQWR